MVAGKFPGSEEWGRLQLLREEEDLRRRPVKCYATDYSLPMRIRSFAHKGLKRLYEDNSTKGVPPDTVDKLRKMFAFLDALVEADELRALTGWKVHTLTGDAKAHGV